MDFHKKMTTITNSADGVTSDQFSEDEETKSIDLVTGEEGGESKVQQISPDKKDVLLDLDRYANPMHRTKREALPLLPSKPVKVMKVKKMDDPKPTFYYPEELDLLEKKTRCPECKHTTCHDLIYGDFCGLQATEYAKKLKEGTCSDIIFKNQFTDLYTSALKFHRYMTTGVIDTISKYELPACMTRSSYRNFFAVFKVDQERVRMKRVVRSGVFYEIRTQSYKFDNDKEL